MYRPLILFLAFLLLYLSFEHSEGKDALAFSDYRSSVVTFANVQYLNCYSTISTDIERFDIAILGAPFDPGTTGRPGARFGPQGIRLGSRRINAVFGYNLYIHKNPFKEWAKIVDCGDAPLTYLDNTVAIRTLEQMHKVVSDRTANSSNVSHTPRIITLGGDHTTTLSSSPETSTRAIHGDKRGDFRVRYPDLSPTRHTRVGGTRWWRLWYSKQRVSQATLSFALTANRAS